MAKKLIVITVFNGRVKYVNEWNETEMNKLHPNECYFGRSLEPGKDYAVFYHNFSEEKGGEVHDKSR